MGGGGDGVFTPQEIGEGEVVVGVSPLDSGSGAGGCSDPMDLDLPV